SPRVPPPPTAPPGAHQPRHDARGPPPPATAPGAPADEAADHAGDAATAADRATAHANAATEAANTASQAVTRAQEVFQLAREVEAEDLKGRTNAGVEQARDAKEAYDLQQAARASAVRDAEARDAEAQRLAAAATQPGADLAEVVSDGRRLALLAMKYGDAWSRAAAEVALASSDEYVVDYIRNGWQEARAQDERFQVERLAEDSIVKEVRDAAEVALKGDAATVHAFLTQGQYDVGAEDFRVEIARIADTGGPVLTDKARAALAAGTPAAYREFLATTQYTARTEDERVRATQLVSEGGPEVQAAARIALEGSPTALHAFIVRGQYMAQRKDMLAATHIEQVQQLIAEAAAVAAKAQQDAAEAQESAAIARDAAAEAAEYARQADASAAKARQHAQEAEQHAREAEASAARAADSAKTARSAANSANVAARDAALSAADATVSSEMAQTSASIAWSAANEARAMARAAKQDAQAALAAAKDAYAVAVHKLRAEEEARRKAAVAAKEKAENDAGARAAEMYRCGFVGCDEMRENHPRWCQQNEVLCGVFADASVLGSALERLYKVTTMFTDLGVLESCSDNLDLQSCWPLLADVAVKSKIRWVETGYDALRKLFKVNRVCQGAKVVEGATFSAQGMSTQLLTAAAAGRKWACGSFNKAYDGDGMIMAAARDGVLDIAVERNDSTTKGYQMFDDVMAHFGAENLRRIESKWVPAMPTNLNEFNKLIRGGKSLEEAAAATFTGRNAARYGFTKIRIVEAEGEPGHYTNVRVDFDRPDQ
ncbi:ALF repeat-containing protein, partial [Streptomyces sp. NPDC006134]|uniref:ALF repeat-containing protein n=1 Tax=Streptomyces sp. NPDC006134 TaxID=3154467 RepID=UPI0033C826CB